MNLFSKFVSMSIKKGKKTMADVSPECFFWCSDGIILKNLKELSGALKKMNKETFQNHVNEEKNDFANWVEDVLGDPETASKLRKAKTKTTALKSVNSQLKNCYSI